MFDRFREGLQKTWRLLNTDVRDLFKQQGHLVDDAFLDQLFAILIKTNMGPGPATAICDRVKSEFRGRVAQMSDVLATVKKQFRELLARSEDGNTQ